jgi:putative tricarboxylic transport membrane protein
LSTSRIACYPSGNITKIREEFLRRDWQITGICLIGFFGLALFLSLEYPLSDELGPGPGFFPFWLSVAGLVLCVALLLQAYRGADGADAWPGILPDKGAAWRLVYVLVALAAAALLLEPLGFRLTMLLFIAGLLLALGARSRLAIGLVAVIGSFGVFHVFYYWLQVPLPIGSFGI